MGDSRDTKPREGAFGEGDNCGRRRLVAAGSSSSGQHSSGHAHGSGQAAGTGSPGGARAGQLSRPTTPRSFLLPTAPRSPTDRAQPPGLHP